MVEFFLWVVVDTKRRDCGRYCLLCCDLLIVILVYVCMRVFFYLPIDVKNMFKRDDFHGGWVDSEISTLDHSSCLDHVYL